MVQFELEGYDFVRLFEVKFLKKTFFLELRQQLKQLFDHNYSCLIVQYCWFSPKYELILLSRDIFQFFGWILCFHGASVRGSSTHEIYR